MKYNVTLGGKVYEVEVEHGEAILVNVADVAAPVPAAVTVSSPTPAAVPASAPVAVSAGEPVKSPLPGVILNIKVNPGDDVKAGQVLLLIEAMKMENEIVAPRDGKIAQIVVSKGSSVDTGAVLLTLA